MSRHAALALVAGAATVSPAFAATRVEVPDAIFAAIGAGQFAAAEEDLFPLINQCLKDQGDTDACVDLTATHMMIMAQRHSPDDEETLLGAMKYVEQAAGASDDTTYLAVSAVCSYYDQRQDPAKATPWFKRRMDLAVAKYGPRASRSVIAAVGYATALYASDRAADAIPVLEPYGNLPSATRDEKLLRAEVLSALGSSYRSAGRARDAEPRLREAHALFAEAAGDGDERTVSALAELAGFLHANGKEDEAQSLGKRALAQAAPGSSARALLGWVGGAVTPGGEEGQLRAQLAAAEGSSGPRSTMAVTVAAQLGTYLLGAGRASEAKPYLDRVAVAARDAAIPEGVRANLLIVIAGAYMRQGQLADARDTMAAAVSLMRGQPDYNQSRLITYEGVLGGLMAMTGNPAQGRGYLKSSGERLIARLATYRDFDAAAQAELRENSPYFRTQVGTDWALAHP